MGTISRRHFLERSLKLAGWAGFGGTQFRDFTGFPFDEAAADKADAAGTRGADGHGTAH